MVRQFEVVVVVGEVIRPSESKYERKEMVNLWGNWTIACGLRIEEGKI